MANIDADLRRHKALRTKRTLLDETWRKCYDMTYPLRGARFSMSGSDASHMDEAQLQSYAKNALSRLFDPTATEAVRTLAAALVAGTVPASSRWLGYGVAGVDDENLPDDARTWLDESADLIWRNTHVSNFDSMVAECMVDVCIPGWFALYCDEAPDGGYQFEQWSLAGVWAAQSKPGGPLDIWHREVIMTAEQVVNEYGENMVSSQVRQMAKTAPDSPVTILQTIYPRDGADGMLAQVMPFASCHYEVQTETLVRERGYHELPIIGPRWMTLPGSVYPVGPVFDAMPAILTLNKTVEMYLGNLDLAVAGMWGGIDDGVLNPNSIKIGPKKVVVMADKDSFFPLTPGGKFDITAHAIEYQQMQVKRLLMADQLEASKDRPQMTATEFQGRVDLVRQLLGPIYGRFMSEFLQPLGLRLFGLAYRAGALGLAPEFLQGRELIVRYLNPMARSQKLADVAAMDRYETTLAQEAMIKPQVLDNYDWDKAARKRRELLGVPADLQIEQDEMDAARQQRAQAEQQAQQAQQVVGVAQVLRDGNGKMSGIKMPTT